MTLVCFKVQTAQTRLFLPLQKRHLVVKNEFAFSFRPMRKSTDGFTQQTRRAVNVNRYSHGEAPPHIERSKKTKLIYPHSAEHSVFSTWRYPQEYATVFIYYIM